MDRVDTWQPARNPRNFLGETKRRGGKELSSGTIDGGLDIPDANHGAGILTYKTGSFLFFFPHLPGEGC